MERVDASALSGPRVSIVITAYRSRHDHLSQAVASALAQTWRNIDVIVSDDSPDDSLRSVVDALDDPRVSYRHNTPALGVARNHWRCFREAQGEFIAVLNHDDWLAPRFVEALAEPLMSEAAATLAFCDHWIIDVAGRRLADESDRNTLAWGRSTLSEGLHQPFTKLVAAQSIPMAMGTLFRRSALPTVLPDHAGPAYDLWLSYLLCRGGGGAWYLPERLSAWRTHADNLSSGGGTAWMHGAAMGWQAMSQDPAFAALRHIAGHKAALGFYGCAVNAWTDGRRLACAGYALRSLRARPTLRGLLACLMPVLPLRLSAIRQMRRGRA